MKISSMIWMCTLPILMALTQSASADSFCETRVLSGKKPSLLLHDVNDIKSLPDCVFEIEDLAVLEIKNAKKLTSISNDISKLTKLEKLVLENTLVEFLPSTLPELKNLKSLTLSENKIGNFTDVILKMDSLEQLRNFDNQDNDFNIAKIPAGAADLPNLKYVGAYSGNAKNFAKFTKLETLELVGEAAMIKGSFESMTNLKEIILKDGTVVSQSIWPDDHRSPLLPKAINEAVKRIEKLELINCNLDEVPKEVFEENSLKSLSLAFNEIKELRDIGEGLENLKELDLSGNPIDTLPGNLKAAKSLTSLSLRNISTMTELPIEINDLNNLEYLYLDSSKIVKMNNFGNNLNKLKKISLQDMELDEIPHVILELDILKELDATNNNLSTIPLVTGTLQEMETLSLGNNKFTEFPTTIVEFINLKSLDLSGGEIKSLPILDDRLQNLEKLDLSNNKFESIPESIFSLKNLKSLNLLDNKISAQIEVKQEEFEFLSKLEELYIVDVEDDCVEEHQKKTLNYSGGLSYNVCVVQKKDQDDWVPKYHDQNDSSDDDGTSATTVAIIVLSILAVILLVATGIYVFFFYKKKKTATPESEPTTPQEHELQAKFVGEQQQANVV